LEGGVVGFLHLHELGRLLDVPTERRRREKVRRCSSATFHNSRHDPPIWRKPDGCSISRLSQQRSPRRMVTVALTGTKARTDRKACRYGFTGPPLSLSFKGKRLRGGMF
jgi:hypothetical protein